MPNIAPGADCSGLVYLRRLCAGDAGTHAVQLWYYGVELPAGKGVPVISIGGSRLLGYPDR